MGCRRYFVYKLFCCCYLRISTILPFQHNSNVNHLNIKIFWQAKSADFEPENISQNLHIYHLNLDIQILRQAKSADFGPENLSYNLDIDHFNLNIKIFWYRHSHD